MKVGVDARALLAGRGVARFTRGLLAALADGLGDDEWLAFVPGRAPVAPVHPRVTLVRHRLGGRALFGAAAVARRPTLAGLARRRRRRLAARPRPGRARRPLRAHRPRPLLGAPPAGLQRLRARLARAGAARARSRAARRR